MATRLPDDDQSVARARFMLRAWIRAGILPYPITDGIPDTLDADPQPETIHLIECFLRGRWLARRLVDPDR